MSASNRNDSGESKRLSRNPLLLQSGLLGAIDAILPENFPDIWEGMLDQGLGTHSSKILQQIDDQRLSQLVRLINTLTQLPDEKKNC